MTDKPAPITGVATVSPTPPILTPSRATWTVDTEAKTSTASILGGVATIFRREETGKFAAKYERASPLPADAPEDAEEGTLEISMPLHDCENLTVAQARAETLIRENLSKSHPELLTAALETEATDLVTNAAPDPF